MSKQTTTKISYRLLTLFVIVVVLGLFLTFDLWEAPERQNFMAFERKSMAKQGRSPASESKSGGGVSDLIESDHIVTLDWNCADKRALSTPGEVNQIRLNVICERAIRRVTNKNNGYTANLFKLGDRLSTDYISIESGTNRLEFQLADGAIGNPPDVFEITIEKQ